MVLVLDRKQRTHAIRQELKQEVNPSYPLRQMLLHLLHSLQPKEREKYLKDE